MLNDFFATGERIVGVPAGAWWQNQLWLAYRNLTGVLTIRAVPVLGDASSSQVWIPGIDLQGDPGLTEWGGRLWLAYAGTDGEWRLASSANGASFGASVPLGFATAFPVTLCGTTDGLFLAWAEDPGGLVHLWHTDDGSTFTDLGVELRTRVRPALAWDEEGRRLAVLWAQRAGGPDSLTIAMAQLPDPDPTLLPRTNSPTPEQAVGLAAAFTGGHGGRRLLFASLRIQPLPGGSNVEGRTLRANSLGNPEAFGGGMVHGLCLTPGGIRVWAAWRSGFQDDLMVAPYDLAFELPQDLQDRIGEECDPKNCPPDPRLACMATDETIWVWEPPHIPNARKGDLVLTPADGVGMVGSLLMQASPPQFYDHMGIMVEDRILIRHATMAHDRIKKEDYYTGSVLGVEPAPTDGLRPDLITYGWPGTLTQTIDDAFYTGFNSWSPRPTDPPFTCLNPRWEFSPVKQNQPKVAMPKPGEPWDAFNKQRLFFDPERTQDEGYSIHNFPNAPAYRMDIGNLVFGRVVKPHPGLEAQDPAIRATLHRIAAQAEKIDGHYRFFSYSRGRIALDASFRAPAAGDSSWGSLPAGARWAAGSEAVVCSSFVWKAVRAASLAALPQLELEGPATESPLEQLGTPGEDGLYRYTETERRAAAQALYAYVSGNARRQVREKLLALSDEYDWVVALAKFGITALVLLLQGPVGVAAAVLGCSENHVADLALLFNDMPDDLGNQMCNVFAFDKASDIDGDGWKNPGEGLAVSPDDIWQFWDSPGPSDGEVRRGLWGHSEQLLLVEGRFEPRRRHRLRRAPGFAVVSGKVLYRGTALTGAEVRIGCDQDLTRIGKTDWPSYYLEVPAGTYEIVAGAYWPATNWWLRARRVVDLGPRDHEIDVELEDPPDWRRLVRISGKIDLVHRVLIGNDDWLHQPIVLETRLTWMPAAWGNPPAGAQRRSETFDYLTDLAGNERVHMSITVWLKEDLSVGASLSVQLLEDYYGDEDEPMHEHIETGANRTLHVPRDGSNKIVIDQKSADWPPDRSHIELTVTNELAPA